MSSTEKNVVINPRPIGPDAQIRGHDFTRSLFESLEKYRDATALVDVLLSQQLTFDELRRKAELVARHLLRHGCRRGDVVAIYSPNSMEWIVFVLAVIRIGAIPSGINALSLPGEMKHYLEKSGAKYMFTVASLAKALTHRLDSKRMFVQGGHGDCISLESMLESRPDLPPLPTFDDLQLSLNDVFLIMFSSGTTGLQKAVQLSHRGLQANFAAQSHDNIAIISPKQVAFAPFSHVAGLFIVFFGILNGSCSFMLTKFEFQTFLKVLQDQQIESTFIVPPIAVLLAKSPEVNDYRLALKHISCGAAPLSEEIENQLIERFPGLKIMQCYGLTETTALGMVMASATEDYKRRPGSVGQPLAHVQAKVVDLTSGEALGPNKTGEICVKGPCVMVGYAGNPEATAETIDKHGWLHTGDIGYYDEDLYFYIVDRLKELIKYNALQVAPAELEAVLLSHPQVADAGVLGVPDSAAGEIPLAMVVKKPETTVTEEELDQYVTQRVAPYKRLRGGIRFVASIPKSPSGKILRREMKASLMRGKL